MKIQCWQRNILSLLSNWLLCCEQKSKSKSKSKSTRDRWLNKKLKVKSTSLSLLELSSIGYLLVSQPNFLQDKELSFHPPSCFSCSRFVSIFVNLLSLDATFRTNHMASCSIHLLHLFSLTWIYSIIQAFSLIAILPLPLSLPSFLAPKRNHREKTCEFNPQVGFRIACSSWSLKLWPKLSK